MIRINTVNNNTTIIGNGITIVNGQVVKGLSASKSQKFDETQTINANGVEKISISTASIDIKVSASDTSEITAHFHGQATINGPIDFDVQLIHHELRIVINFEGNCFNGNLKLDVTVPHKIFKEISVKSTSADITLTDNVSAKQLNLTTTSGDLESEANFSSAFVKTMSGDIFFYVDATQDVMVEISTMSGDVTAEFNNISSLNLSTKTMSGEVKNRHKSSSCYTANVDISTMSGDIMIR